MGVTTALSDAIRMRVYAVGLTSASLPLLEQQRGEHAVLLSCRCGHGACYNRVLAPQSPG
jgi:hypothetical protein